MEGAAYPDAVTMEYCWQLIHEYSILQQSQIFSLIKRFGNYDRKARYRLVERLKEQWHIHTVIHSEEKYLANKASLLPESRYKKQITCFWILLDYFSQVDSHYATGTFTRISMEIAGKDYGIVYVEKGQEQLCMSYIRKGGDALYIVVVEDTVQIPLINSYKIRTFATVGKYGGIEYYTVRSNENGSNTGIS